MTNGKMAGDDGSQAFFDQLMHQRIRRGQGMTNGPTVHGLNRTVPQQRGPITDPYTRTVVDHYSRAFHSGPAHLGGKLLDSQAASNFQVNVDGDEVSTQIQQRLMSMRGKEAMFTEEQIHHVPTQLRGQVMGVYQALQQGRQPFPQHSLARLHEVGNAAMMNGPQQQQQGVQNGFQQQQQQQPQGCRLMEGHPAFRALQTNGFGSTTVLTRAIGQITPQVSSQQYVVKGVVKAYVVPPNMTTINMAAINPNQLIELVEVMAPPMSGLGTFLVPRQAILMAGGGGNMGNRSVITDGRNPMLQQQQHNARPQRKMLLG